MAIRVQTKCVCKDGTHRYNDLQVVQGPGGSGGGARRVSIQKAAGLNATLGFRFRCGDP